MNSDSYTLPLVGGCQSPRSGRAMALTDEHVHRPSETTPKVCDLLPDSAHVAPPYQLAGGFTGFCCSRDSGCKASSRPSHAVVAVYTPDGTLEYQRRILACRLSLLNQGHEHSDDVEEFHKQQLDDAHARTDDETVTGWVDTSRTREQVNGYRRTVREQRWPMLSHPDDVNLSQATDRPVMMSARAIQSTRWGTIEAGAYLWPEPETGAGTEIVSSVLDTLTHRTERLPRPVPTEHWPMFHAHELDAEELAEGMKSIIAELTEEPGEYKPEPGAVLTNLLDRFQAEYDVRRPEAHRALQILKEQNIVTRSEHGLVQLK